MKKAFLGIAITGIVIIASFGFKSIRNITSTELVPYPEGYRYWTHVKTEFVGPTNPGFKFSGGFHHIYANGIGMNGYQTGKFAEGSILVFDVINYKEANGNIEETDRFHLDVMVKDSVKYHSTGGWGFEEFEKDSHEQRNLTVSIQAQCAKCHAAQSDFVFSEFRK